MTAVCGAYNPLRRLVCAPETAWKLLSEWNVTPDDAQIIRQLVYSFESKIAEEWSRGRVFLMGDAYHTMPPFMGQGMCSGIRDAKNLAWKLDLVLRGVADEAILQTYELERRPHTTDWTVISIEVGKLTGMIDVKAAEERDERFRNGWRPPMPDFPKLNDGVLQKRGQVNAIVGDLSLQGPVEMQGRTELFDSHFQPLGFTIVSTIADPRSVLSQRQISVLDGLRTTFAYVGPPGKGAEAIDAEGVYAKYFERNGIAAVINRPDYYVFGTVTRLDDLPDLVDELIEQLTSPARSAG